MTLISPIFGLWPSKQFLKKCLSPLSSIFFPIYATFPNVTVCHSPHSQCLPVSNTRVDNKFARRDPYGIVLCPISCTFSPRDIIGKD